MASSPFGGAVRCNYFTTNRAFLVFFCAFLRRILLNVISQAHNHATMNKQRLEQIEKYVLGFFQSRQQTRILARELFDSTTNFANADLVRALEDLEKKERLLVRHTTEGNDYVSLTPEGTTLLGLSEINNDGDLPAMPHPPKSATNSH
jgi:predicted transcriptional regulator